MQKQKQSQVLVTIVSYFCSSSSILPHQIHCTFFMFFFHTSILLFSIAILRQKIFLVWWYIFSIKWQIILLLTMRFISIICPIKKRSERVSFQRAMIRMFIILRYIIRSAKCHITRCIFVKDKTKVIFINYWSILWSANCHCSSCK